MRILPIIGLLAMFIAEAEAGQQPGAPSGPGTSTGAQAEPVKVYVPGRGATFPELLPFDVAPSSGCKLKVDGKASLSLLVDAKGNPHQIYFLRARGDDLDLYAMQIAHADRFRPATHDGVPITVALSLEMVIKTCLLEVKDSAGNKVDRLQLREPPEQTLRPPEEKPTSSVLLDSGTTGNSGGGDLTHPERIHSGVSAPVPVNDVQAHYSDLARKTGLQGSCIVAVIVDAEGLPQNPHVIRSLGEGLDEKALEAVRRYRFKPAMKDGSPVPTMIAVQVNFRISDRPPGPALTINPPR